MACYFHLFNLFAVWALTGIWHGANWTFLLWGLLYFVVLLTEKLILSKIKHIPAVVGHIYTLLVVLIAWVIFRADTIGQAFQYIASMFHGGLYGLVDDMAVYYLDNAKWLFLLGILFSMPIGKKVSGILREHGQYWVVAVFNIVVFFLAVVSCISSTYNPFIYFNF